MRGLNGLEELLEVDQPVFIRIEPHEPEPSLVPCLLDMLVDARGLPCIQDFKISIFQYFKISRLTGSGEDRDVPLTIGEVACTSDPG